MILIIRLASVAIAIAFSLNWKDGNDETIVCTVVSYPRNAGQSEMSQLFQCQVKLCEEENKENALCTDCDCRFTIQS
jgi:hypothetical protein